MTAPHDPNGRACVGCHFAQLARDSVNDRCGVYESSTFDARLRLSQCGPTGWTWRSAIGPGGAPRPPLRLA